MLHFLEGSIFSVILPSMTSHTKGKVKRKSETMNCEKKKRNYSMDSSDKFIVIQFVKYSLTWQDNLKRQFSFGKCFY